MPHEKRTVGELSCHVVDRLEAGGSPELVVILCHGFGAPGTDLVPVGNELFQLNQGPTKGVQFIFPAAPLSLDEFGMPGGRAWWHLDVERLMLAIARGESRILRDDLPDGLAESRQLLLGLIDQVRRETGLPLCRFVLGGFSQGAMLAIDAALHLDESPAGLCVWSGSLLCESVWKALAPRRSGLKVLQSHGRQDPILPFQGAVWLRDMLLAAGLEVEFIEFDGPHTIPLEGLRRLGEMLGRGEW